MVTEERRESLPPEATLERFGLEAGDTLLDIGAGTGYFALAAAKLVGEAGQVYAVDISKKMLRALKERAEERGLTGNLELIQSEEYQAELEEPADFILLSNVVHEIEARTRFFSNYLTGLKPGGSLAVIEWQSEAMESGPPLAVRVSSQELAAELSEFGLELRNELELNAKQYGILFSKPREE